MSLLLLCFFLSCLCASEAVFVSALVKHIHICVADILFAYITN